MSGRTWRSWLIGAAGATLLGLAGCKSWFGPPKLPDDPLFLSRTPIEAKAETGPPVPVPYSDPAIPAYVVPRPDAMQNVVQR